jgi:hypothetical protein
MAAALTNAGVVEHPAFSSNTTGACVGSPLSCTDAAPPRPPDPTFALTRKSARIAGGVTLLGGRGPFHAFNFSGGLGIRSPGGEEDTGLAPTDGVADLVGDEDLARCTFGAIAAAFFSHDLDSAVGNPNLDQKSSSRSRSP